MILNNKAFQSRHLRLPFPVGSDSLQALTNSVLHDNYTLCTQAHQPSIILQMLHGTGNLKPEMVSGFSYVYHSRFKADVAHSYSNIGAEPVGMH